MEEKGQEETQLIKVEEIDLEKMSLQQKQQAERLYNQLGLNPVVNKVLKEFSNSLSGMDRVTDKVLGPYDVKGRADAVAKVTALVTCSVRNLGGAEMISISWKGPYQLNSITPQDVPSCPGIYQVHTEFHFGRLKGTSSVVYIGSTHDLWGTLHGRRVKNPATAEKILWSNSHVLEVRFMACESVDKARTLEYSLLEEYEKEHWELPPGNGMIRREWRSWVSTQWEKWQRDKSRILGSD